MLETQKEKSKDQSGGQMKKTKRILSKKSEFKTGSSPKELLTNLNTSISVAKGLLATLSSKHQSLWIKKYQQTDPEHLRILLSEVMDEIWNAEGNLTNLESLLKKKYMGICLL